MSQWLYRIVPVRPGMVDDPTAEEAAIVSAHFAYLVGLGDSGALILAGRTQGEGADTFGIIVFTAEDDAAARAVMQDDPAVEAGVFAATLHRYAVAVARDGLVAD